MTTADESSAIAESWVCTCCGYVYDPEIGDPEHGVPPGTRFQDLPEGWVCPLCLALKKAFDPL